MSSVIPPDLAARLLEMGAAALIVTSPDGTIVHVSQACCGLIGYGADELVGRNGLELLHPEDQATAVESLHYIVDRGAPGGSYYALPYRVLHADGSWLHVEFATADLTDDPVVRGLVISLRPLDIEEAVRSTLHELAAGAPLDVVLGLICDGIGAVRTPQHGFLHHAGGVATPHGPQEVLALGRALAAGQDDEGAQPWTLGHAKNGEMFDAASLAAPVRAAAEAAGLAGGWITTVDVAGTPLATLAIWLPEGGPPRPAMRFLGNRFADLAALAFSRAAFEQQLRHSANHDGLTGLANRAHFYEVLHERWPAEALSVVFVDLDGFKAVNDSAGHAAGDEVLKVVARRLERAVREQDLVARLGGDEFAVLLRSGLAADQAARRIEEVLASDIRLERDGGRVRVGASVGWSVRDGGTASPEDLVDAADRSMLGAKRARRR